MFMNFQALKLDILTMDPGLNANGLTTTSTHVVGGVGGGPIVQRGGADGVSVKEPDNSEYYQSLKIVLGTVCGVFGLLGLLLLVSLLYRLYKSRHGSRYNTGPDATELHSSISLDIEPKRVPSVLLLYAYDSFAHMKVVSALAGFLIESFNCSVHLDVFEEQLILERGLADWLVDRLQEVDFIIVLCSVGARLRCTKKRVRFKPDPDQKIPDYFALAVDYVAEKMRVERSKGLPMSRFIVAYMDYSTASDIPHQLEAGTKFCLMKDISSLFSHIHGSSMEPTKNGEIYRGISKDTYDQSEIGEELKVAIESTKEFMKANPNWVEESMEFIPQNKPKSRHIRKNSLEPLLGGVSTSLPMTDSRKTVDTRVDIHNQRIPDQSEHSIPIVSSSLQNRQNSLPSSLSSHQTLTSTPRQQVTSRSYDSIHAPSKYDEEENPLCILCGVEGPHSLQTQCKGRGMSEQRGLGDSEDDSSLYKGKSKSMPTVYGSSIHSSQTVFQADVHNEWSDGMKISASNSQDSGSCKDLVLEDLERDLQSIIMPSYCRTSQSGSVRPRPLSEQFMPQVMPLMFGNQGLLMPRPHDVGQEGTSKQRSAAFGKGMISDHQEDQIIQIQDIRL